MDKSIVSYIPAGHRATNEAVESRLELLKKWKKGTIQVYGFNDTSELRTYLTRFSEKHPEDYMLTANQKDLTFEVTRL